MAFCVSSYQKISNGQVGVWVAQTNAQCIIENVLGEIIAWLLMYHLLKYWVLDDYKYEWLAQKPNAIFKMYSIKSKQDFFIFIF